MNKLSVGPYPLTLPGFWVGGTVHEKPGFFGYNATAIPGASFAFNVLVGCGADAAEKARVVEGMVNGYAPERHLSARSIFQGITFEGHRFEETKPLGPGSVYELYITSAYGDLVMMGFGFVAPLEQEASIRHLFLNMVHGAIIASGYERQGR